MFRGTFAPKTPDEKVSLPFDITDDLGDATVASVDVTIALNAGTEDDPATDTLAASGSATVEVGMLYVPVEKGYHFCDYVVAVKATLSDGRVLTCSGLVPVRNA